MFVRVETRHRPIRPLATFVLVGGCSLLFILLHRFDPAGIAAMLQHYGTVPSRMVAALQRPGVDGIEQLACLFSALFLHADWPHLLGNMVFLLIFGSAAERALGSLPLLVLFLLCGALANFAGAGFYSNLSVPIVGSSGAVSAIVGAYITLFPRARLGIVIPLGVFVEFVRMPAGILIGVWILIQVLFVVVGPVSGALAWPVHVVGFLSGAAFAFLSRPAIVRRLRNG